MMGPGAAEYTGDGLVDLPVRPDHRATEHADGECRHVRAAEVAGVPT